MSYNFDTMRDLIDKLNYYTKLYDEGHPEISDKEWDDLYFQLQKMEEETSVILSNSPTCHIDYVVRNTLPKVEHNHPMLSLAKTKAKEEVVKFLKGHDGIAMAKMDGLTCSIKYSNGAIESAETRGNGIIGEEITHNILWARGVPMEIPVKDEVIIDGEIICTYGDFEEFSDRFANPRNFAAGSIRLLDSAECAKRKLTFIAWDCIKGLEDKNKLSDKLITLDSWGFSFVPFIPLPAEIVDDSYIEHSIILLQQQAKEEQYPIDGIVFKYDDCAYYQSLGATEHHFRGGLAYKFYDEEYETVLRDIEWSIGKTSQLTPVAIFDPVDDGESVTTRASLHNLNIMRQVLGDCPHVGQQIWMVKQNMIIPQISRANKEKPDFAIVFNPPTACPFCGQPTEIRDDFLYCTNPECDGKLINHLDHFCGKKGLDIKGLSKQTLEKLIDWNWVGKIRDIFTLDLYRDEWIKQSGFGIKSVDNILSAIQDKRDCELWQFISGLSIPLIGSTYAKEIAKRCETWKDFRQVKDFYTWNGFGPEMFNALITFNYSEADELVENVLYLKNSLYNQKTINSSITGKTICVTGSLHYFKNRDALIATVEESGGKVSSSVSKKTDYLVNNDIESTSFKNVKAKSLNIPIITEDELVEML